ncbi:MAG: SIR2 family protein [Deltaproteobacteria bacterium]|nr:SIR2 family protein [Deltaproteobacteria bacterium]
MSKDIPPIPTLPKEIKDAVDKEKLAVFFGAGVSKIIGCKGWDGLVKDIVKKCYSESFINYKEKETLLADKDYKKVITICFEILKENKCKNYFYDELEKALIGDEELLNSKNIKNIYEELYRLRGLFITTNADKYLDDKFESNNNLIYKFDEKDFNNSNIYPIDRTKLYRIHGSIKKPESLVFKVDQYISRYRNKKFREFLTKIFSGYTILFIGYGLSEFELLDFMIERFASEQEYKAKDNKRVSRRFILLGFYKGEENIVEMEQKYYKKLGIDIVPYLKDEKGYEQLYDIIERWNKEINEISRYLFDSDHYIKEAIESFSSDKIDKVFQMISDQPNNKLENLFFKKLAVCQNPSPWLKPLKEKGYFNPANNPPPKEKEKGSFYIPYWNILGYLENAASKNPEETAADILSIAEAIIDYRNETGERTDNYHTDNAIIKILFLLQIENIKDKHIDFIGEALKTKWDNSIVFIRIYRTVFPNIIKNKANKLLLKLMDIILEYRKITGAKTGITKYVSIVGSYLADILEEYQTDILNICGIEAAKIAIDKIRAIANEDRSKFSQFAIFEIENKSDYLSNIYDIQLVYFVRDIFKKSAPLTMKQEIKKLIKGDYPILKRIAIYLIDINYQNLKESFWDWKENPINQIQLKHELYNLLNNNCRNFSKDQIKQVIGWIESSDYSQEYKKSWLESMLDTGDSALQKAYDNKRCKAYYPGFNGSFETWTGYISPIEKIELLTKSNKNIAKYFIDYKEAADKACKEGLIREFKASVSELPNKFTDNIKPFLSVPYRYQAALLTGLSETSTDKENKNFDSNNVFDFILQILQDKKFWNKSKDIKSHLIASIIDFIKYYVNNKDNDKLFIKAENILLCMAEKTETMKEIYQIITDKIIIDNFLFSIKGKIFSAMLDYSIRYANLFKRNDKEKWTKNIKQYFDKMLSKSEPHIDFFAILGVYSETLYALDKEWFEDNINLIFQKNNEKNWEVAFTGYLLHSHKKGFFKQIYLIVKKNEHYAKAIKTEFADSFERNFTGHICCGYLYDFEKLEDETSLICQMLKNEKLSHLSETIDFFDIRRKKNDDKSIIKIRERIKPLWAKMLNLLKDNDKSEYKEITASLSEWLFIIDKIDDDISKWLEISIDAMDDVHNINNIIFHFIDSLSKHAEKTPRRVGKIYLYMLNKEIYPDSKKDKIENIVNKLYYKGEKEPADRICNLYLSRGYDFLKLVYKKNNQNY